MGGGKGKGGKGSSGKSTKKKSLKQRQADSWSKAKAAAAARHKTFKANQKKSLKNKSFNVGRKDTVKTAYARRQADAMAGIRSAAAAKHAAFKGVTSKAATKSAAPSANRWSMPSGFDATLGFNPGNPSLGIGDRTAFNKWSAANPRGVAQVGGIQKPKPSLTKSIINHLNPLTSRFGIVNPAMKAIQAGVQSPLGQLGFNKLPQQLQSTIGNVLSAATGDVFKGTYSQHALNQAAQKVLANQETNRILSNFAGKEVREAYVPRTIGPFESYTPSDDNWTFNSAGQIVRQQPGAVGNTTDKTLGTIGEMGELNAVIRRNPYGPTTLNISDFASFNKASTDPNEAPGGLISKGVQSNLMKGWAAAFGNQWGAPGTTNDPTGLAHFSGSVTLPNQNDISFRDALAATGNLPAAPTAAVPRGTNWDIPGIASELGQNLTNTLLGGKVATGTLDSVRDIQGRLPGDPNYDQKGVQIRKSYQNLKDSPLSQGVVGAALGINIKDAINQVDSTAQTLSPYVNRIDPSQPGSFAHSNTRKQLANILSNLDQAPTLGRAISAFTTDDENFEGEGWGWNQETREDIRHTFDKSVTEPTGVEGKDIQTGFSQSWNKPVSAITNRFIAGAGKEILNEAFADTGLNQATGLGVGQGWDVLNKSLDNIKTEGTISKSEVDKLNALKAKYGPGGGELPTAGSITRGLLGWNRGDRGRNTTSGATGLDLRINQLAPSIRSSSDQAAQQSNVELSEWLGELDQQREGYQSSLDQISTGRADAAKSIAEYEKEFGKDPELQSILGSWDTAQSDVLKEREQFDQQRQSNLVAYQQEMDQYNRPVTWGVRGLENLAQSPKQAFGRRERSKKKTTTQTPTISNLAATWGSPLTLNV